MKSSAISVPESMFLSVRMSAPLSVMTVSAPAWLMYGPRAVKSASPNPRRSIPQPIAAVRVFERVGAHESYSLGL
jgi:hypothetical protein